MTGVFTSPGGGLAWTFSVIFRTVGAAVIAPTAAAPTAVFCRKLRLDIFDFFSSAIRFPSVHVRERTSRTISGRPHGLEGYFDVCNIVCYNRMRLDRWMAEEVNGDRVSGRGLRTPAFRCPWSAAGRRRKNPLGPTLHPARPPRRPGPGT